jgi:hypothetical protein
MSERMRRALQTEPVPPGLETRVAARVRQSKRQRIYGWTAAAVAGAVLLVFGVPYLQKMALETELLHEAEPLLARILHPGLQDHVHCAVYRKFAPAPEPLEEVAEDLPPEFRDLAPAVAGKLPEGFRIHLAHVCKYKGRSFVHFAMRRGDELASLMLTRREPGERVTPQELALAASEGGVDTLSGGAKGYQVSAAEGGSWLIYTVSAGDAEANRRLLVALAPVVREHLARV